MPSGQETEWVYPKLAHPQTHRGGTCYKEKEDQMEYISTITTSNALC